MYKINCMNPIAQVGLQNFSSQYEITADAEAADGILVRSASMHEMELPERLLAVARAGAGVNTIPRSMAWWYSIRPALMPTA